MSKIKVVIRSADLPKSKAHRHNRAYEIWRFLEQGQLIAVPLGNNRILKTLQRSQLRLPPVKRENRKIKDNRMGIPKGVYLNARWMEVQKTWDIWDDIDGVQPSSLVYKELVKNGIVYIEGSWYILIYEVVSGLNKLRRQQVHRDYSYQQESLRKHKIIRYVERRIAEHALGLSGLSAAQRGELDKLERRIVARLQTIDFIEAQLSFRKLFVSMVGQEEIKALENLQASLDLAINTLSQKVRLKFFGSFLSVVEERLAVLSTYDIWRSIYWARWQIRATKENLYPLDIEECRVHLAKASGHIDKALATLRSWNSKLPDNESNLVASDVKTT